MRSHDSNKRSAWHPTRGAQAASRVFVEASLEVRLRGTNAFEAAFRRKEHRSMADPRVYNASMRQDSGGEGLGSSTPHEGGGKRGSCWRLVLQTGLRARYIR